MATVEVLLFEGDAGAGPRVAEAMGGLAVQTQGGAYARRQREHKPIRTRRKHRLCWPNHSHTPQKWKS